MASTASPWPCSGATIRSASSISGLLFGFLDHSSGILQVNSIPRSIIDIIKGVIVLTVVIVNEALKRWHNRRTQQASAAMISALELEGASA